MMAPVPALGWQKLEGALVFAAALVALWASGLPMSWWAALGLFFFPDLAFAGYLLGPARGALAYNLVHLYGFGAVVFAAGTLLGAPVLSALGLLWVGHAGFDRMLGYGLKLPTAFSDTHLGRIGRQNSDS